MTSISSIRAQEQINPATLKLVTKVSGLTALATVVIQVAAQHGLFALPTVLKPIFFTSAVTIGVVTFSHFALICGAVALVAWALSALQSSKPKLQLDESEQLRKRLSTALDPQEQALIAKWTSGFNVSEIIAFFDMMDFYDRADIVYPDSAEAFEGKYGIIRDVVRLERYLGKSDGVAEAISYTRFIQAIGAEPMTEETPALVQSVLQLYFIHKYLKITGNFMLPDQEPKDTITAHEVKQLITGIIKDMPERAIYFDAQRQKVNYSTMCQVMANHLNLIAEKRRKGPQV